MPERTGNPINTAALFELFQGLHHTPMYLRAIIQDMIINPSVSLRESAEKRMAQLGEQDREAGQWQQMKAL